MYPHFILASKFLYLYLLLGCMNVHIRYSSSAAYQNVEGQEYTVISSVAEHHVAPQNCQDLLLFIMAETWVLGILP